MSNNKAFKVKNGLDLGEYSKAISDTAVDVFVYDTSKDSDGGAWRKRTQNTSWYNETLNTSTRGSRKEFPAVAVIVAENAKVTIYDGDDPSLPMWMVFDAGSGWNTKIIITTGIIKAVQMFNGIMAFATGSNSQGLVTVDFIKEQSRSYTNVQNYGGIDTLPISQRNSTGHTFSVNTYNHPLPLIVNNTINDVAMTVLPNAPIDAATGLPVPTIAVATDGGVSVIKDDGTVVDSGSTISMDNITFCADGSIYYSRNTVTGRLYYSTQADYEAGDGFGDEVASTNGSLVSYPFNSNRLIHEDNTLFLGGHVNSGTAVDGLGLHYDGATFNTGLWGLITSTYNTGWMNGAIKLATLSDTDDTDVTGSELVTNGTFDSDVSGWSVLNGTFTSSGGRGFLTNTSGYGYAWQSFTTVAGRTYTASADFDRNSSSTRGYLGVGTTSGGGQLGNENNNTDQTGSLSVTFTATGTTTYVNVFGDVSVGTTIYYDNVSVRLAEEDRSVNGNGLQVFGTVTKNPVATGADLVAYSGFNSSNYLKQPYNSDLAQVGTGDFCIMAWLNHSDTDAYIISIHRPDGVGNNRYALEMAGSGVYRFLTQDGSVELLDYTYSATSVWHQVCLIRRSGTKETWINGELKATQTSAANISSTDAELVIGKDYASSTGNLYSGSIALTRISATAPSPEQIKKIYEDEKVLFQENAQATLYGSSDAVTALAYDDSTELLHVGTSAGRSVFQGLRRVDNTTTAVSAAISASNNLVGEQ